MVAWDQPLRALIILDGDSNAVYGAIIEAVVEERDFGCAKMKKTRTAIILLIVLVICGVGIPVGSFIVDIKKDQPQMFSDPIFDSAPPELNLAEGELAILVFSKTNGFRHHEAIPAANKLLSAMAAEHRWTIYFTENGAVFNDRQLSQFDLVVWNNVSGPALTEKQQGAFEAYITSGGGYVGMHASGDGSHKTWPWYVDTVLKSNFTMHPMWPQIQAATLYTETATHPVINGLPSQWAMKDEWYSFDRSARDTGSNVLFTIDENTYDPNFWGMGNDHPLAWAHDVGKGRVVYIAPGHVQSVYENTTYKKLLLNAINWVGGE